MFITALRTADCGPRTDVAAAIDSGTVARIRRTRISGSSAFLLLGVLAGCGRAPSAFGNSTETARANTDDMLGAFANRFTQVRRLGSLDRSHDQMVRHALFPSRAFEDSSLWLPPHRGPTRSVAVNGTLVGAQYHLAARPGAVHPTRPGDIRVLTNITRVGKSEYVWGASSDLALGTLSAEDFFRGIRASLAELERRDERATRAEYHASLPRTTSALGALLTLDTMRAFQRDDGSTAHLVAIAIHPDRAQKIYPKFGKYLDEYLTPARWRLTLQDRTGATWLEAKAAKNLLTIRARTRNGDLLPLEGPARAFPDSLQLRADLFLHVLFFDVGMTELAGDVEIVRTGHERGFAARFRRVPKWHFPLATDRLIKTPLRRPFEGEGSLFRLTVRDSTGAHTVMSRHVRVAVQESAILRWLARLNRTAADDFTSSTDVESNRFLADVFTALRNDVRAPRAVQAKAEGEDQAQ